MAHLVHVALASLTLVLVKTLVELLSVRLRSPLENLPGPPSSSWLRGAYSRLLITARAVEQYFLFRTYGPAFSPSGVGLSSENHRRLWHGSSTPRVFGCKTIIYLPRSFLAVSLTRESGRCLVSDGSCRTSQHLDKRTRRYL